MDNQNIRENSAGTVFKRQSPDNLWTPSGRQDLSCPKNAFRNDRKDINFVEERDGNLTCYEIKWSVKKVKSPDLWLKTYSNATYKIVSRMNFWNIFS